MAYSNVDTKLSLDECAAILGINPAHFNSATADPVAYSPCGGGCQGFWCESAWQSPGAMSRQSLALAIAAAEREVERWVNRPLTPRRRQRLVRIPRDYSPYFGFRTYIGPHLANYVPYGLVSLGTVTVPEDPAPAPLGAAYAPDPGASSMVFSDMDGDTLYETVTLSLPITGEVDPGAVVVYLSGEFGERAGQIRPLRGVAVSSDTLTITLDCW